MNKIYVYIYIWLSIFLGLCIFLSNSLINISKRITIKVYKIVKQSHFLKKFNY